MAGKSKTGRKLTEAQQLIEAFLFDATQCKWPKETKVTTALIKEHGFEFLISLKGRTKMPSMCWFLTENGKKFIADAKSYHNLSFQEQSIPLEESSVAPAVEVNKKPTSFKEFLNLFNNK
jgi:hypothetical protein